MDAIDLHSKVRPPQEREADVFAAELLMPKRHLQRAFAARFGAPIDGTCENLQLIQSLNQGAKKKIGVVEFKLLSPVERAVLVARAEYYLDNFFSSLVEFYEVSPTAMAIQLLQTKLVQ